MELVNVKWRGDFRYLGVDRGIILILILKK